MLVYYNRFLQSGIQTTQNYCYILAKHILADITLGDNVEQLHDQSSHTLEPFQPGEVVLIQDPKTSRWSIEATIISRQNKRSYIVEVDSRKFLRNRRFIRPAATIFMSEPKEQSQRDGSQRDGSQRDCSHRDRSQRDGSQSDRSQRDHFQRDFCQTDTKVLTRNLQQTKARSQRRVTCKS